MFSLRICSLSHFPLSCGGCAIRMHYTCKEFVLVRTRFSMKGRNFAMCRNHWLVAFDGIELRYRIETFSSTTLTFLTNNIHPVPYMRYK